MTDVTQEQYIQDAIEATIANKDAEIAALQSAKDTEIARLESRYEARLQAAIEANTKTYFKYHNALGELGNKDAELANLCSVNCFLERKVATLESNLKFTLELIEAESIPTNIKVEFAPDAETMDPQEWDELCSLFPVKQEETALPSTPIEAMPF